MENFLIFAGIALVAIIIVVNKFRKAVGTSYKNEMYQVLNRMNSNKNNDLFKYEVVSSLYPGMWQLHITTIFNGKEMNVEKLTEMRIDEILIYLLSSEREYINLPKISITLIRENINFYFNENTDAYNKSTLYYKVLF